MKCYRRILRIRWTDRVTNAHIRNILRIPENWLLNDIKRRKLQYFGLIKRRRDSLEKDILEAAVDGKRGRGRPARRWSDDIKEWTGESVTEMGRHAADRDDYRKMIWEATTSQGHAG